LQHNPPQILEKRIGVLGGERVRLGLQKRRLTLGQVILFAEQRLVVRSLRHQHETAQVGNKNLGVPAQVLLDLLAGRHLAHVRVGSLDLQHAPRRHETLERRALRQLLPFDEQAPIGYARALVARMQNEVDRRRKAFARLVEQRF
jgi:hypothetical protein